MNTDRQVAASEDDPADGILMGAYLGFKLQVVPFVIAQGHANCSNAQGDTLLHAAAEGWQYQMLEFLLIAGAKPNAQNHIGDTALHRLTRSANVPESLRTLCPGDVPVARCRSFSELLLRADAGIKNGQGALALHLAAWNGDVEAVNALASSSPIDERSSKGATALALAVLNGHATCTKQLVAFGADVHIELPSGCRIVHYIRQSTDPAMRALAE